MARRAGELDTARLDGLKQRNVPEADARERFRFRMHLDVHVEARVEQAKIDIGCFSTSQYWRIDDRPQRAPPR